MRARVEGFASESSIGGLALHGSMFVIKLGIKNYNPNRIVDAGSQADVAVAEDDVGNSYPPVTTKSDIGVPTRILGQIPPGMVKHVRSDEPEEDVLVFDRPVPGASQIRLTLDASRYGGTGKVRVNIPFTQVFKIQVHANQEWQDTGVETIVGSEVIVTCKGTWKKGHVSCSYTGIDPSVDRQEIALKQMNEEAQRLLRLAPPGWSAENGDTETRSPQKTVPETTGKRRKLLRAS